MSSEFWINDNSNCRICNVKFEDHTDNEIDTCALITRRNEVNLMKRYGKITQ